MTDAEVKIQKALGTLPYKEYMKLGGIIYLNGWWYFPGPFAVERIPWNIVSIYDIEHGLQISDSHVRIVRIDNHNYFPVADGYIDDLYYSLLHNNWTEEHYANELIKLCYQCMPGQGKE